MRWRATTAQSTPHTSTSTPSMPAPPQPSADRPGLTMRWCATMCHQHASATSLSLTAGRHALTCHQCAPSPAPARGLRHPVSILRLNLSNQRRRSILLPSKHIRLRQLGGFRRNHRMLQKRAGACLRRSAALAALRSVEREAAIVVYERQWSKQRRRTSATALSPSGANSAIRRPAERSHKKGKGLP